MPDIVDLQYYTYSDKFQTIIPSNTCVRNVTDVIISPDTRQIIDEPDLEDLFATFPKVQALVLWFYMHNLWMIDILKYQKHGLTWFGLCVYYDEYSNLLYDWDFDNFRTFLLVSFFEKTHNIRTVMFFEASMYDAMDPEYFFAP
uniref:Uncharacterized protein n=1 Tax=Panagrellus redivivus TaxID=6233 RepID=A0A7E4UVN3_PANRE